MEEALAVAMEEALEADDTNQLVSISPWSGLFIEPILPINTTTTFSPSIRLLGSSMIL